MTDEPPAPDDLEHDFSLSLEAGNLLALPIALISLAVIILPFVGIHGSDSFDAIFAREGLAYGALFALVAVVVVHEALHAAGFLLAGAPRHSVKFGFHLNTLTPYAHCAVPVPAGPLRVAALLPGVALGVLPAFVSLVLGWPTLMAFGAFCTVISAGDFLTVWLFRSVPRDVLLKDHPTRLGCYQPRSRSDDAAPGPGA